MEQLTLSFSDIMNHPSLSLDPKDYIKKKPDNSKIVATLRKNAESLLNQAEKINTEVNGNWTNRRQAFADSAARKKERLLARVRILNHLAEDWEKDTLLPIGLEKIRTGPDIEYVYYHGYPPKPDKDSGDWYVKEYPEKLKKANRLGMFSQEDADRIKAGLICLETEEITPEQEIAKKLREALKEVHRFNILGFFPTPDDLIDIMIDHADLNDDHYLLEPSAGIGSIVDRIRYHGFKCKINCVELYPSLEAILRLKGYNSSCEDILATDKIQEHMYDRILMNPPFEKGQDIDHVMHCFAKYLKPGGKLISIMSTSSITGNSNKHNIFANFRAERHAYYIENGSAFKNAFNSTGTTSIILIVDK